MTGPVGYLRIVGCFVCDKHKPAYIYQVLVESKPQKPYKPICPKCGQITRKLD